MHDFCKKKSLPIIIELERALPTINSIIYVKHLIYGLNPRCTISLHLSLDLFTVSISSGLVFAILSLVFNAYSLFIYDLFAPDSKNRLHGIFSGIINAQKTVKLSSF